MNVYQLDVNIVGTAYIKADSPEQALEIATRDLLDAGLEFSDRHDPVGDNICVDGCVYNGLAENEEDIAFSPAFSINANQNSFTLEDLELTEENIEVEEDA